MRRRWITTSAATLVFAFGSAAAQDGDLAGVTMRVLDDVSDIRAVILDLDASRGANEEGDQGSRPRADEADEADAAERGAGEAAASEGDRSRERAPLHSPDHDEDSEGKLEDNDVEVPAAPTP